MRRHLRSALDHPLGASEVATLADSELEARCLALDQAALARASSWENRVCTAGPELCRSPPGSPSPQAALSARCEPSPPPMRAPGTPEAGRSGLPLPTRSLLLLLLPALVARAVPCVSGDLPKPTNITFLSINMKNVLKWNPPEDLHGIEVTYTVQYFIYGQKKWLSTSTCRNINRTYCDLSAETSDYEHQYYAKVKAIWETNCSKWAETGRFYPFLETQIGPPQVALTTGEKSISIVLTAPEKWKRNPKDNPVSMQQIYSNLKYNVSVYNTKSKKMWSQCIRNNTVVLTWLESNTVYCVHVQSFVPGPPRLALPSQKQCVSTLEDQTSALKVKIIFHYILPTSVIVFLFSVIGYFIYRYIHVGKEKHPANLILIYENEIDKRVFEPTEKITFNFISLNILDDSKMSPKDMSLLEESNNESNLDDPEASGSPEHHLEKVELPHLGYSSHLMDIFCVAEESLSDASLIQHEWLSSTVPTGTADSEYDIPTDFCRGPEDHQLPGQEEAGRQGNFSEPQAALGNLDPQTLLCSYIPQLNDLHHLVQEHLGSEDRSEEEPFTTLVDWDPQVGRLCIPSLPRFQQDPEDCETYGYDPFSELGLLSRLYENQAPNKPAEENENYLMQFMEEWGLHIQMEN